jgi:four helix bundle protein
MASRCDAPIELVRQLLRAGTSVGANMEEAQCAQSRADLISKCSIACKEARESLYWLRLIHRTSDAPQAELDALISEADQLVSIITACIKNLKAL